MFSHIGIIAFHFDVCDITRVSMRCSDTGVNAGANQK